MNRAIAAAVLFAALLAAYAGPGSRADAQGSKTYTSTFPFGKGDTVRLQLHEDDRGGNQICAIDGFSGTFLICKSATDQPFAINLDKVYKATLTAKATQ